LAGQANPTKIVSKFDEISASLFGPELMKNCVKKSDFWLCRHMKGVSARQKFHDPNAASMVMAILWKVPLAVRQNKDFKHEPSIMYSAVLSAGLVMAELQSL
jgi:hypothetical protein